MQTRWPRSRISPVFCEVWPAMTGLARDVRTRGPVAERLPPQQPGRLAVHRQVGSYLAWTKMCVSVSW